MNLPKTKSSRSDVASNVQGTVDDHAWPEYVPRIGKLKYRKRKFDHRLIALNPKKNYLSFESYYVRTAYPKESSVRSLGTFQSPGLDTPIPPSDGDFSRKTQRQHRAAAVVVDSLHYGLI